MPISRRVQFAFAGLFAVPYLLCAAADGGAQRTVEAQLTPEAMFAEMKKEMFVLPQLRIYDDAGRRIFDLADSDPDTGERRIREALAAPRADGSTDALRDEWRRVGLEPPADRRAGELTIVELWAEWCQPCVSLHERVKKILADTAVPPITLLHVNANPEKILVSSPPPPASPVDSAP